MDQPPGWVRTTIEDIVDRLQYGYTAKAEHDEGKRGPAFLRITDIARGGVDWSSVPHCRLSLEELAKYKLEDGDLVFARTGSIEKACLINRPPEAVFASYLIRGRPVDGRTGPWLGAFVGTFLYRNQASAASAGIGRANVNAKSLGRITLLLPPLLEQHRIVAAIESYFTRLDDAVATLERVQRNLKRYHASVLKAAVEGRLVPTEAELARAEGRRYEPASDLLERILAERRRRWEEAELTKMKARGKAPKDDNWKAKYVEPVAPDTSELPALPEGWCWVTVDQIVTEPLANGRSVKTAAIGFPVLRLTALQGGSIDTNEQKIGAWTAQEAQSYLVRGGDFLVSRGNGSIRLVGIGGLVRSLSDSVAYPDTMIRLRLSEKVQPKLFAQVWNSRTVRNQVEPKAKTTAGIFKVNQGDLETCVIPLPPAREQRRIHAEIERLFSMADAAAALSVGSVTRCARLRQSILKWAFEGRLVDQDPSDEPASVLLERIRAERETSRSGESRRSSRRTESHA